jgi:hypothetical protein
MLRGDGMPSTPHALLGARIGDRWILFVVVNGCKSITRPPNSPSPLVMRLGFAAFPLSELSPSTTSLVPGNFWNRISDRPWSYCHFQR